VVGGMCWCATMKGFEPG